MAQTPDDFNPGVGGVVYATAIQADGKILVGGDFTTLGGQPCTNIGGLHSDGTVDMAFNPSASSTVYCLAVQADGKILAGGDFTTLGGEPRNHFGRLNSDGTVDINFNPGASGRVSCLAVQPDGKILVGGDFGMLGGGMRNNFGRLNSDGTLDTSFDPRVVGYVYCVAVQPDGRILVGGLFTTLGGEPRDNIGRLESDGTPDTNFNPGAVGSVYCLAVQADGKVLVGGAITRLAGATRLELGRLNADGTLDISFSPTRPGTDYRTVYGLSLQADGGILVTSRERLWNTSSWDRLNRLHTDGTPDSSFDVPVDRRVYSVAAQADGKVLIGGNFSNLAGRLRAGIGRVSNTAAATQSLSCDDAGITWLRGGTSPEVWSTTFDATTNGTDWVRLGAGARIADGWRLPGVSVRPGATLRARGIVTGGRYNGSSWFVETNLFISPPIIVQQPASQTNKAGTTATFSVDAEGTPPLLFQWCRDGVSLADGGLISDVHTSTLTISNVSAFDARGYSVVVSNSFGSVTSLLATLTIGEVFITTQPHSTILAAGSLSAFSVEAAGTPPFGYQWRKDGVRLADGGKISGAQTSSLFLSGVLRADEGGYSVIVTNAFGSVTSLVATLKVLDPYISSHPRSANASPGETVWLMVGAAGTPPLTYQWRKDGAVLAGASNSLLTLAGVQGTDAGNYNVLVSNRFGVLTSRVAQVAVNLATVDGFSNYVMGVVYAAVPQPDGKVLLGGMFTNIARQRRRYIGRLNANGVLDTAFNPGASGNVFCLALQPDGKILVGGTFTNLADLPCRSLGRLHGDGTRDSTFNVSIDGWVYCVMLQPDGKILVGGDFTTLNGPNRTNIIRLESNGTLDTNFNPIVDGRVFTLALQPDGKIVLGGRFHIIDGQSCRNLGRVNGDGTLDTSFSPPQSLPQVFCLALQTDGRILIGCDGGPGGPVHGLYRLNTNGTLDATFRPTFSYSVYSLAVQTDGKIVVGGGPWDYLPTWQGSYLIGRLNNDGTTDLTFNPAMSGESGQRPWTQLWHTSAYSLALQADGRVLVGGDFSEVNGQHRTGICRLNNTAPATESVTCTGSEITWLRTGTGPEVRHTSFEVSTNGVDWANLGAGTRIPGGWQLTGVPVPPGATIRARGFVSGGHFNGSGYFLETTAVANQLPVADASATRLTVVSANNRDALVLLNGTRSFDPDGDPLQYAWYEAGNADLLAAGVVAVVRLPLGRNALMLVVSDGALSATNAFSVEVLTPAQAIERLIALVNARWPRARPLVASLKAALASIKRGNTRAAINQLEAFQSKVRVQVQPQNPALAAEFIAASQEIIVALHGETSHMGFPTQSPLTSVMRGPHGRAKVQLTAPAGVSYIVEASTNLVNWEAVGLAQDQGDGTYAFDDADAAKFPRRYYRVQQARVGDK